LGAQGLWERLSTRNPHREFGIGVLEKLIRLEVAALPISEISFDCPPSPAHIIRDLFGAQRHRIRNQLLDVDCDTVTSMCDFVAGWVALAHDPGSDVTNPSQTPFSASDILATTEGLSACGARPPRLIYETDVVARPVDFETDSGDCDLRLTTTISPAGSITDPHIDGTGSGLYLFQLFGTKVLFTWPASVENLQWMEKMGLHGRKRGPLTLSQAIDELSELRVNVLSGHKSVALDPGMIHAVMSPDNSAIAGWDFVNFQWLKLDNVRAQMAWEAELAQKQKAGLLGDLYDISCYLSDDLKLWNKLAVKIGDRQDDCRMIRKVIEEIRAAMKGSLAIC
jgi:hypothetical protein